jgi:hypothetical protein
MTYQYKMAQKALLLQDSLEVAEDADGQEAEQADELTWQALELFSQTLEAELEGDLSWTH